VVRPRATGRGDAGRLTGTMVPHVASAVV